MTITFPMTMPTTGVDKSSFDIERVDFAAPEAGGALGGVQAGFPRWIMQLSLTTMSPADYELWRAWLALQRNSQRPFIAFDPDRRRPRAYPSGAGYVATPSTWSQSIGSNGLATLTLTGLAAGQVISVGDHIGFAWGSGAKRTIARACETAIGTGGTAVFAAEPPLPYFVPTVAGGCAVTLDSASCLMRLIPGETKLADIAIGYMEAGGSVAAAQDLRP